MATKTTKKTTTARKTVAKKPATTGAASKVARVLDKGTETSYKTKYHVMCIFTAVFAVICGVLFWTLCNKQMDYEDDLNCVAEDVNCTLPNKRADKNNNNEDTSYYDASTVEQNAVSAAGQE